jgi:Ca2+-binding RTX toxin-like protein
LLPVSFGRCGAVGLAVCVELAACVAVARALPAVVDLPTQATFELDVPAGSVAPAGDVNGDGAPDVIVGVPGESGSAVLAARGGAYVVFSGPDLPSHPTRAQLLARSIWIRGRAPGPSDPDGQVGAQVAGIGDVNGDGLADVAVAAPDERSFFRPAPNGIKSEVRGDTYILYGRRMPGTIDLAHLSAADGFVVRGAGQALADVGDVNGDGKDDIVVAPPDEGSSRGSLYVLLGGNLGPIADIQKAGSAAWKIEGAPGDLYFTSAAGVGDVNADGIDDFAVGAPNSLDAPLDPTDSEPDGPGAAYVIYGRRDTSTLALDKLGHTGIAIRSKQYVKVGTQVTGVGDVTGDGRPDIAISAPFLGSKLGANGGRFGGGGAILVDGQTAPGTYDAGALPIIVKNQTPFTGLGFAMATAGDLDGDGRQDLLLGATNIANAPADNGAEIALSGGSTIQLPGRTSELGPQTGAATDINANGTRDVLITLPYCGGALLAIDPALPLPPPPGAGPDTLTGTSVADKLFGGGGNDTIHGQAGDDCLHGDAGNDTVVGDSGNDTLYGDNGNDSLSGGAGADNLDGAAGDDRISGGNGVDDIDAGPGNDTVHGGPNGSPRQPGFEGDVERIIGGAGNDRLYGDGGPDQLIGDAGDDLLVGGSGDDVLEVGVGHDRAYAGPGNDTISAEGDGSDITGDYLNAGPGNDRIFALNHHRDTIDCGPGHDTVEADRTDRLRHCEKISHASPFAP